jgi:hypothetical protein
MRSAKPYSNRTFTRRVDHDGGRHRAARAPREPVRCPGCRAVYIRRRWSRDPAARRQVALAPAPADIRLCPACRRRASGVPHGFVHVAGEFFAAHRGDIEPLLRNEVERACEDNPLHQVLAWNDLSGGGLLVTTATEHLAQRLGHALEKAYSGEVRYGFSHENKLAHVWWRR